MEESDLKGSQGVPRDLSTIFFANIDERRGMSMKKLDPKGFQAVLWGPKASPVLFHYKSSSFRGHKEF